MSRPWGRRPNWPQGLLAAFCLAMMAVIGTELAPSEPAAGQIVLPGRRLEHRADAAEMPSFTMPPASAFAAVLARPLFSRTRRPGTQAGTLPSSSSFTLIAIVISGEDRHALLGSGQPLKIARVTEGGEIGGWTVETILPDAVVVRHNDLREKVKPTDLRRAMVAKSPSTASVISDLPKPASGSRKPHDE